VIAKGLILLAMLLVVGVGLVALVCLMMARVLLSPPRMSDGRALWILKRLGPSDLGLPWEDVSFVLRDERTNGELKIAGWWIPAAAASNRCVVIVHGYADSKIGGIAWAPTFRAMGFNVLAIDLRAHGESGGAQTTAGYFERHDVSRVIDQLRANRPAETAEIVLFGVSLGAAVVGAAAALRDDVTAVIMDCPYSDYPTAAGTHARTMGMPGPVFQRIAIRWAQRLSGADFYACAPTRVIPALACPLMVIHGADDLFVDPVDMDAVEAATKSRAAALGPTVYWRAANTHHVLALRTDPAEFRRRVEAFLADARVHRARAVASATSESSMTSRGNTITQEITP
jgi:pimeloyl-ACP methyl ester carboxylesterase